MTRDERAAMAGQRLRALADAWLLENRTHPSQHIRQDLDVRPSWAAIDEAIAELAAYETRCRAEGRAAELASLESTRSIRAQVVEMDVDTAIEAAVDAAIRDYVAARREEVARQRDDEYDRSEALLGWPFSDRDARAARERELAINRRAKARLGGVEMEARALRHAAEHQWWEHRDQWAARRAA